MVLVDYIGIFLHFRILLTDDYITTKITPKMEKNYYVKYFQLNKVTSGINYTICIYYIHLQCLGKKKNMCVYCHMSKKSRVGRY